MLFSKMLVLATLASTSGAWTLSFSPPARVEGGSFAFSVNYSFCPDDLDAVLDEALKIWNGVPTSYLKLARLGTNVFTGANISSGAHPGFAIVCDRDYSASTGADANATLAVAIARTRDGDMINNGGIVVNVQTNIYNALSYNQKVFTLAHEIGHLLGLGHTSDPAAIMYYEVRGHDSKPAIGQDDIDAMTFLYPRNEFKGEPSGLFGCGSLKAVNGDGDDDGSSPLSAFSLLLISVFFVFFWQALRRPIQD